MRFGAEVVPVSREQGGFVGSIKLSEEFAHDARPTSFLPRQFENQANVEAHEATTGPEIERQLAKRRPAPRRLRRRGGHRRHGDGRGALPARASPKVRVHPLEPADSPTLRTGHKVGKHRIQGISDEFIPGIVKLDELDEVVDVWDGDAILMAQALGNGLGLAVGISSGANFLGAVQLVEELGDGRHGGDHPPRQQQEVPLHRPVPLRAGEGGLPLSAG